MECRSSSLRKKSGTLRSGDQAGQEIKLNRDRDCNCATTVLMSKHADRHNEMVLSSLQSPPSRQLRLVITLVIYLKFVSWLCATLYIEAIIRNVLTLHSM